MHRLTVAIVLGCATHAMAAPDEPIVLASGDDTFRAALSDALAPAGMLVVSVAEPPSPTIGDVASTSRELADGQRASATVWLVLAGDGATLVTYDREVDRVLVRSLPYRSPLTPTQAAEAARMARTMLRALRVTPDLNLPPPRAVDAAAVRAHAATPSIVAAPPVASELALEVGGGVRVGGPTSNAGAVGMMAIIWRPDRLGAVLSGAFAPSSDVRTSMFTGAAADDSLALSVRLPWRLSDQIAIAASAGVAVHRVALEGSLPDGGSTSVARIDPAAHAGLTCTYDFGSFSLDLGVTADGLLRRQAYEIGTIEVLRIPVFQLSAGLGLTARIL